MEITSDKNTILVISDVHQDIARLESILKKENYDIVVSLGDWFDSRSRNTQQDVINTCDFLKKWIFKPNFFTCIGNHDIQYLYSNATTICSGYNREKDKIITKEFGSFMPAIRDKFLWYLWIDDFLCSHAGVHPFWLPPRQEITKAALSHWLNEQIKFAEPALINGGRHWLYGAGQGRGGSLRVGGLTWNCFESEFEPIEGVKQIVGHTSHRTIINHVEDGHVDLTQADNLDIDCNLNEYLTILNGKLKINKLYEL